MPEIDTARLRLRHFTLDDFDDLFRLYSDSQVMQYLSLRTREQTQASLCKHIQHWQEYNFSMWAVIDLESGKMIGRYGLGFLDNTPEVELGYVFDKSYWHKGLLIEASQATLKYGFEEVKLEPIVAAALTGKYRFRAGDSESRYEVRKKCSSLRRRCCILRCLSWGMAIR